MYKVLVFGMTQNPGGVESFLMSYYRKINKSKIRFDFLCNTKEKIAYEDEILSMGSRIFKISARSKHPIRYKKELNDFFKKNASNYDCIWVNVNSLANIDYLKLAKRYGIKRRIIHSHNSQNMDGKFRGLLHTHNKKVIANYATDFWACSESAANWFYDDKLISNAKIIKNAIDLSKVKFDPFKRKQIRKKYSLTNQLVLGNVGRLHFQKNQIFAIRVLNEMLKSKSNVKLVLIGDGPDRNMIKEKIDELKLEDSVVLAGVQNNVADWLSAFDIFIFPSVFEGLPIAGVEAEANGLPILASTSINSSDLRINPNLNYCDLKDGEKKWAQKILNMSLKRVSQEEIKNNFNEAGYNIDTEVKKLEKLLVENE